MQAVTGSTRYTVVFAVILITGYIIEVRIGEWGKRSARTFPCSKLRGVSHIRLAQLRTGAHWLREETGSWNEVDRAIRTCLR